MPDASGRFKGQGWSRAKEDSWTRVFVPVDDQINRLKREQAQTDRGLPPYRFPENVAVEDVRFAAFKRGGLEEVKRVMGWKN